MSYSLKSIIIDPISKEKPESAVILCHGYGGDGKDISILANYWKNFLPKTIFICPDAPEKCSISPSGYQWFELGEYSEDQILAKSLVSETKLNKLIDEVKERNNISANKIVLSGFSQGCMISLQTGIKRKDKINCILGYSGRIISPNYLGKNINSRPNVMLMHGDKDMVVPITSLLEAKDFFNKNNYSIETKIFKNCEHRIPTEGSSIGLEFIKKNLY